LENILIEINWKRWLDKKRDDGYYIIMNFFVGNKMKNWNFFLIGIWSIIIFGIICSGCDDGDGNNGSGENDSDEYYVKYEVNSSSNNSEKLNVTLTNEKNNNTVIIIATGKQWETVIGPVKKGFNAKLNINANPVYSWHTYRLYPQISVSKNNSPFALKKIDTSDTTRNSVQINYIIDF
jgi:hypothetical protein